MKIVILALILSAASPLPAAVEPASGDAYEFLLAKLDAEAGRLTDALDRFDLLIKRKPGDPVLRYERALVLADARKVEAAVQELRALVVLSPDFYDAQKLLGRILLDTSGGDRLKVDQALVFLQNALRLSPGDVGTGLTIAQILISGGRHEEAEKVLATMLERSPDQRALNFTYAQILTKLGRGNESQAYLERVVNSDPSYTPAVLQLIDIYQRSQAWEKAAGLLGPLIEQDPLNVEFQRQQAFLLLRAGASEKARLILDPIVTANPADERASFYLAEALSDLGHSKEAAAIYQKLLEKSPNDSDVLLSFGLSQMAQRKFDEARTTFQSLLGLTEKNEAMAAMLRTQLALVDLRSGEYGKAADAARKVLVFNKQPNLQAVSILADALRREKKFDEGVEALSSLDKQFPDDTFISSRLVEFLLRAGEKEKATQLARTRSKKNKPLALAVVEAFARAGKYDEALAILAPVQRSSPEDADLHFELGSLHERAGRFKEAEAAFLGLLEKKPDHAQTLNYIGYMWADRGVNLERAEELLERAVRQEPRNAAFVDSLGWVYFRREKLDLAEKHLSDAARLLPSDPTIHAHLGDLFARRGDFPRALEKYREALRLDPDGEEETEIKAKIVEAEKRGAAPRR